MTNIYTKVKSIALIRNSEERKITVADTATSEEIIRTIENVFGLPSDSYLMLVEDDTDEILSSASWIFFWSNSNPVPKYRVVIRGEKLTGRGTTVFTYQLLILTVYLLQENRNQPHHHRNPRLSTRMIRSQQPPIMKSPPYQRTNLLQSQRNRMIRRKRATTKQWWIAKLLQIQARYLWVSWHRN